MVYSVFALQVLVTQASSEHSMSVAVDGSAGSAAAAALQRAFELELTRGDIKEIVCADGFAMVSVIGPMRGVQGTISKFVHGITAVAANIFAVAQGSSERSISVIVGRECMHAVLQAVHDSFLGDAPTLTRRASFIAD
jgi:aspartokinase/homoserine dehydrogenase 1